MRTYGRLPSFSSHRVAAMPQGLSRWSGEMTKRFSGKSGQQPSPCRCERLLHRRVVHCKPGEVTEPMFDDLLGAHA